MSDAISSVHARAVRALNTEQYEVVIELCEELLVLDSLFADAWFLKAMAVLGQKDIRQAVPNLIRALENAPQNPEYLAQYAKLCLITNQKDKASLAADRALEARPKQALTLDTLGVIYTKLGAHEKAEQVFKQAVTVSPLNPQFHFNLASAQQFLGKATLAEYHYSKALELKPEFARAHWALSELKKNVPDISRIAVLDGLLDGDNLSDNDELYLCHALSREREKNNEFQLAFDLLERGKSRYRKNLNYSWRDDERLFSALENVFPFQHSTEVNLIQGSEAIFVLGMPRSGTTLVDRILCSHPKVESLGELQNFGIAIKHGAMTKSPSILDTLVIEKTSSMDLSGIGQTYLRSLEQYRSSSQNRPEKFVDKMPLNFMYIGHIAESLPAAKIVLLNRNAMDTCLSNFRQLFAVSFSYYNYHYNIQDTGHYFRMFSSLMKKFQRLYKKRIHVVDYELLTENPEGETRRLLEFCGLEWNSDCLRFYENSAPVATASAMQVREPIYRTSVQRWKKYENQLEPIKVIFNEACIKY